MKQKFIIEIETNKKNFNSWILEHDKVVRDKTLDDAIQYFEKHAHEVYDHVSARDFICDRLEELKNKIWEVHMESAWIPVEERLPEELTPVNITWINRNPEQYYADIKDVPFSATGVFHRGKWYWWSTVVVDYLSEYGRYDMDLVDKDIEIVAWQPLPKAYRTSEENTHTEK